MAVILPVITASIKPGAIHRRIPTTPTNARTRPAGWGTTPTPEEGLWTRKGWAGRTH